MDPQLIPVLVAGGGMLFGAVVWVQTRLKQAARDDLGRALGLARTTGGWCGTLDGVDVKVLVDASRGGAGGGSPTVSLEVPELQDVQLATREGVDTEADVRLTGDPAFDQRLVGRIPPSALGLFDARTRELLVSRDAVRLEDGRLGLVYRSGASADQVRAGVAVAQRWRTADRTAALVALATSDPVVGVRLQALRALSHHPESGPVLARLTADPVVAVAAMARILVGEGDLSGAFAVAPPAIQHALLEALAEHGTPAQLASAVRGLADAPYVAQVWWKATGCARAAATPEVRDAVLHTMSRLVGRGGVFVADRAMFAITGAADPALQPRVLALLPEVDQGAVFAADWLSAHGTVDAVPMLAALGTPEGERAKAAIQARAGGGVGALSLAATLPEVGALSEASAPAGALAVAGDPTEGD